MYDIQRMMNLRMVLLRCIYAIGKETFELPPSLKAMLLDSNLKIIFRRYKDSKFFKRKFVIKGHIDYEFGFKKRLFSLWRLSKILDQHKFQVIIKGGAPFIYSSTGRYWKLSTKFDYFFQKISDKKIIPFLSGFADNVILVARR